MNSNARLLTLVAYIICSHSIPFATAMPSVCETVCELCSKGVVIEGHELSDKFHSEGERKFCLDTLPRCNCLKQSEYNVAFFLLICVAILIFMICKCIYRCARFMNPGIQERIEREQRRVRRRDRRIGGNQVLPTAATPLFQPQVQANPRPASRPPSYDTLVPGIIITPPETHSPKSEDEIPPPSYADAVNRN